MGSGILVLNKPGVYLVDADGNVITLADGGTIGDAEAILVAGKDGTVARFIGVDSTGKMAVQNPPNLDAALSTLATESKLEAVRALLATIDADTSNLDVALSTLATESTLEAVRVLLASIDGKDFATQTTLAAADTKLGTIDSVLDSIKDTDGIKKITDALPAGTNRIGAVRPVDINDVALDVADNTTIPANTRGFLPMGEDETGKARRITAIDDGGVVRLAMTGTVTIQPAPPPEGGTPVQIAADSPLDVSSSETTDYTITNGKTFYLQQISAGAEGDPTEKGSKITVQYYDGSTYHVLLRIYIMGESITTTYPDVMETRDGTDMDGDGSTKYIRVTRENFGGSSKEIDCVLYGYELDT